MMGVVEFGKELLRTLDLDPVYVMLKHSSLPYNQLERWCIAYWMFYHSGVSSELSECRSIFWSIAETGIARWPRGTERRHFRGPKAIAAVRTLELKHPQPTSFIANILSSGHTFHAVTTRVEEYPQFGPWIAFKVADMIDRVLRIPIAPVGCDLLFYKEPAEGLKLATQQLKLKSPLETVRHLLTTFKDYPAPPANDRSIDLPEIETILCKWKAHVNGHYPIGKDTHETVHMLEQFPCSTSRELLNVLQEYTRCTTTKRLF